jgi:hypothetical protein
LFQQLFNIQFLDLLHHVELEQFAGENAEKPSKFPLSWETMLVHRA